MRVPVFLDAWQYECCGAGFGVGDVVRWQLAAATGSQQATLGAYGETRDVELPVAGRCGAAGDEPEGCLLSLGELHVFVPEVGGTAPDRLSRCVRLLAEDHHGQLPGRLPETVGTVATLREVGRAYDAGGAPAAGSSVLTYVHRATRGVRAGAGRSFVGFLVELDVQTET